MELFLHLHIICFMAECYHMMLVVNKKSNITWDEFEQYTESFGAKFFTLVRPVAHNDAAFKRLVQKESKKYPEFKDKLMMARKLIRILDATKCRDKVIKWVLDCCNRTKMTPDMILFDKRYHWIDIRETLAEHIDVVFSSMCNNARLV